MTSTEPRATIAELTRDRLHSLTKSERKVARALLQAYPVAGLESLVRLAAAADVSAPTALRFVQKLGLGSYPEFQSRLRGEISERTRSPASRYPAVTAPDGDPAASGIAAFATAARTLDATVNSVSAEEFAASVALLADTRRRVWILGGRISHVIASYLAAQLTQLRPDVYLLRSDQGLMHEKVLDLGPRDVLLAIDYRRYQQDTVRFAQHAAAHKAAVISMTDPLFSPIAEFAQQVLTFHVDSASPFDSLIGCFALAEGLLSGVAVSLSNSGRARLRQAEVLASEWMWDSPTAHGDRRPADARNAP